MVGLSRRDSYVKVDGLSLRYQEWGDAADRPLVLLHTLQDCADNWDPLASQLSRGYRTIALDYRGHGESDWADPGSYEMADYTNDVNGLVTHLGLADIVLIGHSAGGRSAIAYAAKHPEHVAALVALDCDIDLATAPKSDESDHVEAASREWDSIEAVIEHMRRMQPGSNAETLERQALHLTRRLDDGHRVWRSDPAVLGVGDESGVAREWSALDCPVLVVQGRQSRVLGHEPAVRMREAARRARVAELEGGGHWLHQEIPGAVEAAIRWFLGSPPP